MLKKALKKAVAAYKSEDYVSSIGGSDLGGDLSSEEINSLKGQLSELQLLQMEAAPGERNHLMHKVKEVKKALKAAVDSHKSGAADETSSVGSGRSRTELIHSGADPFVKSPASQQKGGFGSTAPTGRVPAK